LLAVRRRLAAASLPADVRAALQQRFIAICDAIKVPGANSARCARRLAELLAEVDQADTGEN
jgi:hypothetical protein